MTSKPFARYTIRNMAWMKAFSLLAALTFLLSPPLGPLAFQAAPPRAPHQDSIEWEIETVDSEGVVGEYTSLALDRDGYPHISYYDATNEALKYVYKDSSGWHIETVYEGTWDRGRYTSLALDGNEYPHITCFDYNWNTLEYFYQDESGWHREKAAGGGGGDDIGRYSSMALDGSGFPHVSYYDAAVDKFYYGYKDNSGWHNELVDLKTGLLTGHPWHSSIAVDESGCPCIAYRSIQDYSLRYAHKYSFGFWQKTTVDDEGGVGRYPSIALDGDEYPHISYYDDTNDALKYAYKDGSGWHTETVDSSGDVGRYTSLGLDRRGYPHISYYDSNNNALKFAYWDGSDWQVETVDSEGDVGAWTSLALDGGGAVHISYYDGTHGDLKYATCPSLWEPHLIYLPLVLKE
jgi:hypothetical protein